MCFYLSWWTETDMSMNYEQWWSDVCTVPRNERGLLHVFYLGFRTDNTSCNKAERKYSVIALLARQTRYTDPMLVQCWTSVADDGATLKQHGVSVLCWSGIMWCQRWYFYLYHWRNGGVMVGQRRRRWVNISPTLGQQSWFRLDICRPVSFPSNKFVKRFTKMAAIVNVVIFFNQYDVLWYFL